ncbi:GNAT family N-acetyltransferase [Sessilibacter corallicola]|uniref:GNAT family N-acetyltransferase n=1 Tax=Sessilibacter corallicola TaxID=2904075 RepID=UPI001E381BB1|nr:GNAT family N-acetyltransferase [Sessilibacter corallicola]MCE2029577.1 GNAT family N-acetyltransferase [Sessilibacter corallicola]
MSMKWINESPLEGELVILEPVTLEHIEGLTEAVKDGELWKLWYANVPTPNQMHEYVKEAIESSASGGMAYVVRMKESGNIVGTTRYYSVDNKNKRAMIGYTWYSDSARRTRVNTECKLLLLQEIFETYNAIAVEFRTHFHNTASRKAIERLGAKQDGILRSHQIMRDGSLRDTVVYSIVAAEWLAVKRNLQSRLSV